MTKTFAAAAIRFSSTLLVATALEAHSPPASLAQENSPLTDLNREQIRAIVAQSALSNCYLLRSGIASKTAFRANTAAAISQLKDTGNQIYSRIKPDERSKFQRLLSLQIASSATRICPELIPEDVKEAVNEIESKLNQKNQ